VDEGFADFAYASGGALRNLALSLTGNPADAEDLVQVTLERVMRSWRSQPPAHPLAYARKALVRAYISERRRVRWRRESSVDTATLDTGPTAAEDPTAHMRLVEVLATLPRRQREAVVLRYLEDLPVAEVADLMRCSEGNVKRCAFEGLRALREQLDSTPHTVPSTGGRP